MSFNSNFQDTFDKFITAHLELAYVFSGLLESGDPDDGGEETESLDRESTPPGVFVFKRGEDGIERQISVEDAPPEVKDIIRKVLGDLKAGRFSTTKPNRTDLEE